MLGAFKGSPYKALEVEAAVPPPEVRFEKACNNYSLRILLFHKDHPIKQALYQEVKDELQEEEEEEEEDLGQLQGLQPTTQLLSLGVRLQQLVTTGWNIEKPLAHWTKPWEPKIQAKITITTGGKKQAKKTHLNLLQGLKRTMEPTNKATTVVFYTGGSQGTIEEKITNSATLYRISTNLTPILANC